VQLARNRARPRRTVRGAARVRGAGAAHGLGRRSACGPRASARQPSSASAGTARAARGARRHCPATRVSAAALLGEPAATRHRRTGDDGDGGSPARRRRHDAMATGDGRARRGDRQRSGRRGFGPRRSMSGEHEARSSERGVQGKTALSAGAGERGAVGTRGVLSRQWL
jgi:hypothetical protein